MPRKPRPIKLTTVDSDNPLTIEEFVKTTQILMRAVERRAAMERDEVGQSEQVQDDVDKGRGR